MSSATKVHVYVHTHWDREWYRTFQQYRLRLIEVIDLILEELDKNQLEYFTLDGQSIVLEDYLAVRPKNKERLIHYIKEGRLDIGPWFVLPDEFLVSGESLIENIAIGHKTCAQYGNVNKIGYIPDSFGHSSDIPRIFKGFDIDNCIAWRGINTEHTEFIWYSQDRSYVNAYHLLNGYLGDIFEKDFDYDINKKTELMVKAADAIKTKTNLDRILLPIGGDHRPPPINLANQLKEINNLQSKYNFVQSGLSYFLNRIDPENIKEKLQQELRDCAKTYILPAVFSSRLYLKQHNAQLTNKINQVIEPLTCYCNAFKLDHFKFPDSEYLWKLLITNHPHDSICGCSVDEVHTEMEQRYTELHEACDEVINRAKVCLMKQTPQGKVNVFNSSNFSYTGPVVLKNAIQPDSSLKSQVLSDYKDRHFKYYNDLYYQLPATFEENQQDLLLWVEDIPPFSAKTIEKTEIKNPVSIKEGIISNGLIEIQVNNDSITLKDIQKNLELPGLNQIIDRPDCGDTYNFGPVKNTIPAKANIISSTIKEIGPIRAILELTYQIDIPEELDNNNTPFDTLISHEIKCDVIVTANSKLVEFNLEWENKSKNHLLQAVFPVEEDIYSTMVENHFGTLERRFDPHYDIYEHIPARKATELKVNFAPAQRFVQAKDIALFNEGLPEYEVFKNELRLTILRSTGYLSIENTQTRAAYAGPELATPGNQCLRVNRARYAIHPKTTEPNLFMLAERFMGCTTCFEGISETQGEALPQKPAVRWTNPNVIATRYKYAEEEDAVILHLLNLTCFPQQLDLIANFKYICINETNLTNLITNKDTPNNLLTMTPYELKAILIKLKKEENR